MRKTSTIGAFGPGEGDGIEWGEREGGVEVDGAGSDAAICDGEETAANARYTRSGE